MFGFPNRPKIRRAVQSDAAISLARDLCQRGKLRTSNDKGDEKQKDEGVPELLRMHHVYELVEVLKSLFGHEKRVLVIK